ncbi:unnamed protein product [Moneuplotes crassus]|uniref:Uncharacterized protein n=1 Tax=Euplotes crassus TaxID=5936 RepID=A0AAD1UC56_EUPCR|nr:unnamed protein product [Moneuplotes crassus]
MDKKEQFSIFECGKNSNPFIHPFSGSYELIDKYRIREETFAPKILNNYGVVEHSYPQYNNEEIMCSFEKLSGKAFQEQINLNEKISEKDYQAQLNKASPTNANMGEAFDPLEFFCESEKEYENFGNNTKPCLTNKDFQSIPDLQQVIEPDLPPIPIIRFGKEESPAKLDTKKNVRMDHKEETKDYLVSKHQEAIILKFSESNESEKSSKFLQEPAQEKKRTLNLSKVQEGQEAQKDDFEWNNFLVRRACFRGLSEFYKKRFSKINISWQRRRVNKKKKTPMHELIKEFARNEFGKFVDTLGLEEWTEFRNTLYSVLFSHRYKKTDDFLEGVNFSVIRGVLYSYTTELRVELMSNPFFSIMMLKFLEKGKSNFLKEKLKGKPVLYSEEVNSELDSLEEEARGILSNFKFIE